MKMDDGGPNLQASDLYSEHTHICKCNTTTMASSYRGLRFEAELDATVSCNTFGELPDELESLQLCEMIFGSSVPLQHSVNIVSSGFILFVMENTIR